MCSNIPDRRKSYLSVVLEEEEASTDRSDEDYVCETATELSAGY
jgi:hypothetical protein